MNAHPSVLRDFTVDRRVWLLCAAALGIGASAAALAVLLLRGIALATNLFYYHRLSLAMVGPAGSTLPRWLMPLVPVVGGLIIGVMARYGSDKIRGHGIPEAIEAILLRGARVDAKVALLKPISAAISIGSGGPFGAEGPIIMTGGAFGSLVAQWLRLSDAERTTLLVAGAAAGMSATFAAPVASVLLAVELLLFEWRPRSIVPVAAASAVAGVLRVYWLGAGPLFPVSIAINAHLGGVAVAATALGLAVGLASAGLSRMMYGFEDLFERLPVHWMWWPALGGLGVGLGGVFFPRGLGVGYDNIAELLRGGAPWGLLLGLLVGKSLMWAFSLGSGTSGGVLAPLLMIGAAMGESLARVLHAPAGAEGLWALVGMGAMLSGSLGVPLTAIIFSLELTHSLPSLLPLLLGCMGAYVVTSLAMPRSILTEKLARRGVHLSREYGVDPLEQVSVGEVMGGVVPSDASAVAAQGEYAAQLTSAAVGKPRGEPGFVFAYADEPCRAAAERMAMQGLTCMPVLDRASRRTVGSVSAGDLLSGRRRSVERESARSRAFAGG